MRATIERGLVVSFAGVDGDRSILVARDAVTVADSEGDDATRITDATEVQFSTGTFRCDDAVLWGKEVGGDGVLVAPRELWGAIERTIAPDPSHRCDGMAWREPGRAVVGALTPEQPGDAWIADVVRTSPLLRARWEPATRTPGLDAALRQMLDGDDAAAVGAARSLEPPRPARRWWGHRPAAEPLLHADPADAVRIACLAAVGEGTRAQWQWEHGRAWDAVRELRGIAASMLGGPAWIPGLWPEGIDRIVGRIEAA